MRNLVQEMIGAGTSVRYQKDIYKEGNARGTYRHMTKLHRMLLHWSIIEILE